jgi:DNA-binding CsgD family transcriptional regulator
VARLYVSLGTLARATRLLDSLADLDNPAGASEIILPALAELVGCDVVAYNEINPAQGRAFYTDYPSGWLTPELTTVFNAHVHEHPLVNHIVDTGDGGPLKMSDFLGRQGFHRLGLYSEFFRPIGIEHQMGFSLPSPPGQLVAYAVNRGQGDFTEEDRALLAVVMDPINRAVHRARRRQKAQVALEATAPPAGADLTDREFAVLELAAQGRTNSSIARALGVSPRTIAKHLEHVYRKLGVTSRAAAVYRAVGRSVEDVALRIAVCWHRTAVAG